MNTEEIPFVKDWLSDQQSFIVHTSGSTSTPKPITITRSQMKASASQTQRALGLEKGDTALICLSVDHIAGKMMLVRTMEIGLESTVVEPCANPFEKNKIEQSFDFIAFVPLQMEAILDSEYAYLLNDSKAIIVGGGPISASLEKKIQSVKSPVYHTYGMTETVSHIALRKLNGTDKSIYFEALEETQLSLDTRGCLVINSPVTNHEDVVTNDLVELNGKRFKWLGRIDNIINSGGIKVNPEKVEVRVDEYFSERNTPVKFFVSGVQNDHLGEEVSLVIEGQEFETNELLSVLRSKLNKFEVPRKVFFVKEFLTTASGKIDKIRIIESLK